VVWSCTGTKNWRTRTLSRPKDKKGQRPRRTVKIFETERRGRPLLLKRHFYTHNLVLHRSMAMDVRTNLMVIKICSSYFVWFQNYVYIMGLWNRHLTEAIFVKYLL
jgi:hypothetical protein